MARARISEETWILLLKSFRSDPADCHLAATRAGVSLPTAQRAWMIGAPRSKDGTRPERPAIRLLVDQESAAARAALAAKEAEAAERDEVALKAREFEAEVFSARARAQSVATRKEEGQLVQTARQASLLGLAAATRAGVAMVPLLDRLGVEVRALAERQQWDDDQLERSLRLYQRYASATRALADAGHRALEMERVVLGDPERVRDDLESMPLDELVEAAGLHEEVIRRAEERGLVVLDGGKKRRADDEAGQG